MQETEVISARLDKSVKNQLEEISKKLGYPTISEFLRDELIELSERDNVSTGSSTLERKPIDIKSCPILKAFAKLRCSNCIFHKRAKEIADPGPPPENLET